MREAHLVKDLITLVVCVASVFVGTRIKTDRGTGGDCFNKSCSALNAYAPVFPEEFSLDYYINNHYHTS